MAAHAGHSGNLVDLGSGGRLATPVLLVGVDGTPLVTADRLAADNLALPTAPDVLALQMLYDQVGANLDMARAAIPGTTALTVGVRAGGLYALDSAAQASWVPVESYASNGDTKNQNYRGLIVASRPEGYNPTSTQWDRLRANYEGVLLASAARTTTTNSADQTNINARGVRVRINVSALAATPSITVAIQEKDSISGNYISILTSAAILTTGQKATLVVYPGATPAANVAVSEPLPRTWRVSVVHGNADSITYSVDFALVL